ncbi:hypothetical protein ACKI14_50305, partial [Streptomyces turgidiscabies]|uniref:hypothetical protein n=1 Tax=Streptomyces turgidiscabies TaxID=85558 RepID=UPI0038F5E024
GQIADVRLWNTALSQSTINTLMSTRLLGNESGLTGYWKLGESAGTTAYDSSSTGNNGTVAGSNAGSNHQSQDNFTVASGG